jgi:hypothetical protein
MQETLERAVENERRRLLLAESNAAYAKADAQSPKRSSEDLAAWVDEGS